MERFDRVDLLINNAGQGLHLPLEKISLKDLVAIMELNFYAPQVLCRRSCRSFMIGAGARSSTSVRDRCGGCFPAWGLLDPSLTLTRTQHPAILSNSETKKQLTYAVFASLCKLLQRLTYHP